MPSDDARTDDVVERRDLASEMLDGLDEGHHYSVLAYDDEREPIEVAWNYDSEPARLYPTDDFTDRAESERRRELAIDHQQQFEDGSDRQRSDDAPPSGLYDKYDVRKDGEPVEECFVLEPASDPAAREALLSYASAIDNEELSDDLREWAYEYILDEGDAPTGGDDGAE